MLLKLKVENIVLIESAELDFSAGLNILSGETGAGKSLLIDCLMLLFGARYDKNLLRYGAQSGTTEGIFSLNETAKKQMSELGFEEDDLAIISRRFYTDGKNEIRINGRLSTASMLKTLMSSLTDIYGQNDHQYYSDKNAQLHVLDYYTIHSAHISVNNANISDTYSEKNIASLYEQILDEYKNYKKIAAELTELGETAERAKNIDFFRYQIKEIEESRVQKDEEEELVAKRRVALNSAQIIDLINESRENLTENQLHSALNALNKLANYTDEAGALAERLHSVIIETQDILYTLSKSAEDYDFDSQYLDKLEDRLSQVRAIKRKYGSFDSMINFLEEAKLRLDKLEHCDETYAELSGLKEKSVKKLYQMSEQLSKIRRNAAKLLSSSIQAELRELGMETASFEIRFATLPNASECENYLSANGLDDIEFYLSTNMGQPLKPFLKIISGGEMSRFMLALKVVTGGMDKIPTLIFDEIDSGISGKVGQEVAKKLARISKNHQVLCVTHLPQIAAMADTHFYISKGVKNGNTLTEITKLNEEGMVSEISRLCGSIGISNKSESNAGEMKIWSEKYKSSLVK